METIRELLRQGKKREIWDRCCGFLDLSLEEFMETQRRLLLEQIEIMSGCELGRHIMKGQRPKTVEEFRRLVPLTTYQDYVPFLLEKREDVLPFKDVAWVRTSGRSGEYQFKWIPYQDSVTREEAGKKCLATALFSCCSRKGEVALEENDKFLYLFAPPPYVSGFVGHAMAEFFPFDVLPTIDEADRMPFGERIGLGLKLAMTRGLDTSWGIASIMAKVGEELAQRAKEGRKKGGGPPPPRALARLLLGMARAKLAGRPLYPKDLWQVKGLAVMGVDSAVYKDQVKEYWGKNPLECYVGTEVAMVSTQTWDYEGLTFLPDLNFLEFIPEEESLRTRQDPSYQPQTVLLDGVQPGKNYEVVVTNFKLGVLMRYRPGDMIRIIARRNQRLGIDLPQMTFYSRCDDIIDLAGFPRLTEKTIWQAISDTGIPYEDWVARKELEGEQPVLHLYVEVKDQAVSPQTMAEEVHEQLKRLDPDYRDLEQMLGVKPIKVTFLSPGTFQRFLEQRVAEGADLGHMKPIRMQPREKVMENIMRAASSA